MWWRRSAGARRSPPYGCSIDRCCAARAPPTYFISISSQEAGNNLQINCHFYGGGAAGCTRSAVRDDVVPRKSQGEAHIQLDAHCQPAGLALFALFGWGWFYLFIYLCISIVFVLTIYFSFLYFWGLSLPICSILRRFLSENLCGLALGMTSHHIS